MVGKPRFRSTRLIPLMSNNYLLTCDCGNSVAVGTSQAGQQVNCSCGRRLAVPSLRAIRQLPVAVEKPGSKPATRPGTWNPVKGATFAMGALMVLGGLLVAAHSYSIYSQVSDLRPSTEQYEESLKNIDSMSPADLFDAWNFIKEHGLEEGGPSPYVIVQGIAKEKLQLIYIGLAVAAVGFLVAIIPAIFSRK